MKRVEVKPPKYGTKAMAAQSRVGAMARICTASVSPGSAPATTLGPALTAIGDALTAQVQANEGVGSTATVIASVVDNHLQIALSGTTQTHNLSFGVGGDTSNALGILGLTGTGTTAESSGS